MDKGSRANINVQNSDINRKIIRWDCSRRNSSVSYLQNATTRRKFEHVILENPKWMFTEKCTKW